MEELSEKVLFIPSDTKYWFVRADSKAKFYEDFKINNFIAIGGNEISMDTLFSIEPKDRVTFPLLENRYKSIFNNKYLDMALLDAENNHRTLSVKEQTDLKRSSSVTSSNNYMFVEKMNIGDVVLVPYTSSKKFLLGVIISDVSEDPINRAAIGGDDDYVICDYKKKRRILWLKEILNKDLPDKLRWIQYAHQSVFDISSVGELINPLITPKYIYKEKFYYRIGVETTEPVSDDSFFGFQKVLHDSKLPGTNIFQKSKVQSRGDFLLSVLQNDWGTLIAVGEMLFGNHSLGKLKVTGIIPFLYNQYSKEARSARNANIAENKLREEEANQKIQQLQSKSELDEINVEKAKLEVTRAKVDIESISEDVKAKQIENTKNNRQQNNLNKIIQLNHHSELRETQSITPNKPDAETIKSIKAMKLTDAEVGDELPHQTQKDLIFPIEDTQISEK